MRKGQQSTLSAILAAGIGAATAGAVLLDGIGLVPSAQAQSGEDKKRREQQDRERPPPQRPHTQPGGSPPPSRFTQPPPSSGPGPRPMQPRELPRQEPRPYQVNPHAKDLPPSRPAQQLQPPPGSDLKKREGAPYIQPPPGQPGVRPPPATFKNVPPAVPGTPARPQTVAPGQQPGQPGQPGPQGFAPKRYDDMKRFRVERFEKGGERKVIQEPDRRFIIKERNQTIVRHDEAERFLRRPGARQDRRPDGTVETYYLGRDGARICTVVDANGRLLRRYRIDRDGRERNIIDNRRFYRNLALGVGVGVGLGIIALNLPPPHVTIPRDEYIVDYDRASDDDLYETLIAPPIENLDRPYSLEEIRDNYELRARLRSIDIDSVYFDTAAWEVTPDQYGKLERIARAILRVLEGNPDAVFLIAGYTDAVGSDEDNASLSDRRAAAVAQVLTDQFDVPAENLVTQGYGEQYLKIDTPGPEPRNRRVSIQNVTGLMAER